MKQKLKTTLKGALLAGFATVAVNSAQAQYAPLGGAYATGDALVGFTTGGGNDLIVNLGSISSLINGDEWNLDSLLTGAGFSSALNSINWGVVGISSGTYYSTAQYNTSARGNVSAQNGLATVFGSIGSSGYEIDAASDADSWYNTVDTTGNGYSYTPANLIGVGIDTTTPGSGSFTFAQDGANWYANYPSGTEQTYGFSFSSDGLLVYGSPSAVPEPATLSILSGAGLLLLAFRRRIANI